MGFEYHFYQVCACMHTQHRNHDKKSLKHANLFSKHFVHIHEPIQVNITYSLSQDTVH